MYRTIVKILTDFENYKTQVKYDSTIIQKEFIMSFLVSYSPLFYIGILKTFFQNGNLPIYFFDGSYFNNTECLNKNCFNELTIQMLIIFMGYQYATQIILLVYYPIAFLMQKLYTDFINKEDNLVLEKDLSSYPQYIKDGLKEPYSSKDGYSFKAIQFGFITLFAASFPLAPLFALIGNLLQIRIDCILLNTQCRRPFAFQAKGIGFWNILLQVLAGLSSITNGFIIAFNSRFFGERIVPLFNVNPFIVQLGFVILFNYFVFLTRLVVAWLVEDVPSKVYESKEREKYINKLETGEEVEDDDGDSEVQLTI